MPALTDRHEPLHRTRRAGAYRTDDGQDVCAHTLHAFDCTCGYRGRVFMASQARAMAIYDRNHAVEGVAR
jgi:hypothetical protein